MRVLGIDPGLRALGWGVIDVDGTRLRHIANGTIRSGQGELAIRLNRLFEGLSEIVTRFSPVAAAVESTFVNTNAVSTLKLGQARGVALLVPARAGVPVGEYAPNAIKKTVVGVGHADKSQIAHMVKMQLPGATLESADSADALAVAICHAYHLSSSKRIAEAAR